MLRCFTVSWNKTIKYLSLFPARNIVCVRADHVKNVPSKHKQVAQVKNKSPVCLLAGE